MVDHHAQRRQPETTANVEAPYWIATTYPLISLLVEGSECEAHHSCNSNFKQVPRSTCEVQSQVINHIYNATLMK